MKNISANLGRISDDYFFRENLYKYSFEIKQTFWTRENNRKRNKKCDICIRKTILYGVIWCNFSLKNISIRLLFSKFGGYNAMYASKSRFFC